MFELGRLNFSWYGFILGVALIVGCYLVELKTKKIGLSNNNLNEALIWVVVGGLFGARLWHVFTDWYLYQSNIWSILEVWRGGLSILGALAGGVIALWGYTRYYPNRLPLGTLLDLSVFGLPFGQAIGRIANFVNQELYGYPSSLPWAIFIDRKHRISGFENYSNFHPLFAYEIIFLLIGGSIIWYIYNRKVDFYWQIGKGNLFLLYAEYYALVRVGLDFLRLDKAVLVLGLGTNQVLLLLFLVGNGYWLWKKYEKSRRLA